MPADPETALREAHKDCGRTTKCPCWTRGANDEARAHLPTPRLREFIEYVRAMADQPDMTPTRLARAVNAVFGGAALAAREPEPLDERRALFEAGRATGTVEGWADYTNAPHDDEYDALARQFHESIADGQSVAETATALRLLAREPEPLDVERLSHALAIAEVNCWANPRSGHKIDDRDGDAAHRADAEAIARAYAALSEEKP